MAGRCRLCEAAGRRGAGGNRDAARPSRSKDDAGRPRWSAGGLRQARAARVGQPGPGSRRCASGCFVNARERAGGTSRNVSCKYCTCWRRAMATKTSASSSSSARTRSMCTCATCAPNRAPAHARRPFPWLGERACWPESLSPMPARHRKDDPFVIADARHGTSYGCASRLDQAAFAARNRALPNNLFRR